MITPQFWSIPASTLTPEQLSEKSATLYKRLQDIGARFSKVRFATSLAAEDMVITDAISKTKTSIALFTLATGRLHQETVDMVKTTEDHYGLRIDKIYPDEDDVDAFVDIAFKRHGLQRDQSGGNEDLIAAFNRVKSKHCTLFVDFEEALRLRRARPEPIAAIMQRGNGLDIGQDLNAGEDRLPPRGKRVGFGLHGRDDRIFPERGAGFLLVAIGVVSGNTQDHRRHTEGVADVAGGIAASLDILQFLRCQADSLIIHAAFHDHCAATAASAKREGVQPDLQFVYLFLGQIR